MKRCPKDGIVSADEHCNGCIFDKKDKFGRYYCDYKERKWLKR